MSSTAHFDSLVSRLGAFVAGLPEELKNALPADFNDNLGKLATDFAEEGKSIVATEVDAAEKRWPEEATALAPMIREFADQKIDQAKAAAQAEVTKWEGIQASLPGA